MKTKLSNQAENNPTIHERLRKSNQNVSIEIENIVRRQKIGYIDAIIQYCEDNDIDLERAKEFVQGTLRGKVEAEARSLHLMPQKNKLPL